MGFLKYVELVYYLALTCCLFPSKQKFKSKARRCCITSQKLTYGKVRGEQHEDGNTT